MKALILSDIHSNIYALESIWELEKDCDLIYCTGDLVDYGPYPREVLDWVRDHAVICTQGNHDSWLVLNFRSGNILEHIPPDERAWVHHNADLLTGVDIEYLDSLPIAVTFQMDGIQYGLTHLYKDYQEIVSAAAFHMFCAETFAANNASKITRLVFGHTHRQAVRYLNDDILWLNPGSVSYRRPDDPDQSAHYATITDGTLSLKQTAYDLRPLRRYVKGISLKASEKEVAEWFFGFR